MSVKYLYEKDYKSEGKPQIERIIFKSSKDLFDYLQQKGETIFNAGFKDAEISLYRVEEYEVCEK